jgi:Flp pilus assembly protein TadG
MCCKPCSKTRALRPHRFPANQRGSTLVEAALVAPLVFMLLMGIIQYGLIIASYVTVRTSSAGTARFVTLHPGITCSDSRVTAYGKQSVGPLLDSGLVSVSCTSTSVTDPNTNLAVAAVQVEISYPLNLFFAWVVPQAVNGTLTLRGITVMQ